GLSRAHGVVALFPHSTSRRRHCCRRISRMHSAACCAKKRARRSGGLGFGDEPIESAAIRAYRRQPWKPSAERELFRTTGSTLIKVATVSAGEVFAGVRPLASMCAEIDRPGEIV